MKPLGSASLLTSLVLGVNLALLSPAKAQNEVDWKPQQATKTQTQFPSRESYLHQREQTPRGGDDPHLRSEEPNELDVASQSTASSSNSVIAKTSGSELESSRKLNESDPSISRPFEQITPVSQLSGVQSNQSNSEAQEMPDPSSSPPFEQITPVSQLSGVQSTQSSSEDLEMPDLTTGEPMEQVTSVSQLSDVKPGDWAFEALRSLVERYGCIAGYPDGTFRGNRALSRYEFAAGLNACLNQVERLISANVSNFVRKEDLVTLQRLQEEFKAELASLGTRVDQLEGRVAALEPNQFSTTTKLTGQVEFGLISAFGDKKAVPSGQTPSEELDEIPTLGGSAVLAFTTSFTGRDLLTIGLVAGNIDPFAADVTGTDMTTLDFGLKTLGVSTSTNGSVFLAPAKYTFPIGNSAQGLIGVSGVSFSYLPNINYAQTLSAFGTGNPFYLFSSGGGAGVNYDINDKINISAVYVANSISNPGSGSGLFNGGYGAAAQLTLHPFSQDSAFSLIYGHTYSPEQSVTGPTGSQFAEFPFGQGTARSTDIFSLEFGWDITPQFGVGIWGGYINAKAESSPSANGLNASRGANADIWYWATGVQFNDLIRKGSELGLVFGMPPKLVGNDVPGRSDRDTTYHVEGYFAFPLTANLFVTPGFVGLLNPEHNSENNNIWIGTIVMSFYF